MVFVPAASASRPITGHSKNTGRTLPMIWIRIQLDVQRVTQRKGQSDAGNQSRNMDRQGGGVGYSDLAVFKNMGWFVPAFDAKAKNPKTVGL